MKKRMREQVWVTKGDYVYGYGYKDGPVWMLWACNQSITMKPIHYKIAKVTFEQAVEYRTTITHGNTRTWQEAEQWLRKHCPDGHIVWSRRVPALLLGDLEPGIWQAIFIMEDVPTAVEGWWRLRLIMLSCLSL